MLKHIIILLFFLSNIFAVSPIQGKITFTKKDGSTFEGYLKGDEYLSWIKTENGDLVVFNNKSRDYEYAKIKEEDGIKSLIGSGIEYKPKYGIKKALNSKSISKEEALNENELFQLRKERKENIFLIKKKNSSKTN